MASYLFPYQQQTIQPYQSPLETYARALAVKDDRFNRSLANLRSRYDSILNTPLTNEENQMTLRAGVEKAMNRLSKVSPNDITLPENQAEINSVFDSILDDQDLMYDAAWTRHYGKEIKKAEDIQKRNPELVPPQNLEPLYLAQEDFRKAPKGGRPRPVSFSPYYDYNKKVNEDLDKIKADVDRIFSVNTNQVEGPDGKMHSVSNPLQYTVKQLKDYKVKQLSWSRLNTDAQALNQMSLDYNYNTRNGLYPPTAAISGIDSELSTYSSLASALSQALNSGKTFDNKDLTQNDRDTYTSRQKAVNQEIANLQDLKKQIKIDPSKANKWFSFNKYIKDYVEGKVAQYTYKEDSLISSVPGLDELTKYQLDVWKEQWKAKFDAEKEATKAKTEKFDAATIVRAPYNEIITRLSSNPGGINLTNTEMQAMGQMTADNKGRMYMNWSGNNTNPDNTLIFTPAQGSFDKKQMNVIDGNIVLAKLKGELQSLGIDKPFDDTIALSATEGGPSPVRQEYTGTELLDEYTKNPNGANSKVKAIIDKYKPFMSKYGVDPTNIDQRKKLESELNDPTIEQAVKAGTTLNLNGRFEMVPDQGVNFMTGDNGKLYMKGKFIVPLSKLKEAVSDPRDLPDLITNWEVISTGGDDDGKYEKSNEQAFGVSVYVPVNGDVTKINDRLLDVDNFQQQWGKDAPQMREISRQKVMQFQGTLQRSQSFPDFNLPISRNSEGNYSVSYGPGAVYPKNLNEQYEAVNKMAVELSTRTGQDFNTAYQQMFKIISENQDKLQRQIALENYIISSQQPSSGFRSFATYAEGRAALENQLELYKTGRTGQNLGPTSTLLQAMSTYAPASDNNNPQAYAQFIANKLGVTVNTPISQINTKQWADAIEQMEGNTKGNNPGNLRPTN